MLNNLALIPTGPELWILVAIIVIFFGGKKIPELMRGVGRGVGELHKGLEEGKRAMAEAAREEESKAETLVEPKTV